MNVRPNNMRGQALCLGYPCSVDVGIDPVVVVQDTLSRYQRFPPEIKDKIRRLLCRLCFCDEGIDDDGLLSKAQGMRDSWGYATAQDYTMMHQDVKKVVPGMSGSRNSSQGIQLTITSFSRYIQLMKQTMNV